jgi:ABC-type branched-subunit amino acid transport system ATPase component
MLLNTDGVHSGYGLIEILHGVSIEVDEGRITCLVGPNGSGKSTFLQTVFGYIKPTKGRVTFEGHDITGHAPESIMRMGVSYLLQGRSVFPQLTVKENLLIGAYVLRDKTLVAKRLEEVYSRYPDLRTHVNRRAGDLSGGQQRMIEFGRALMMEPKLILLDEPSTGLAPVLVDQIYDEIVKLSKQGITFLIVEQNVRKILSIADFGYVLALGKTVFSGPTSRLKHEEKIVSLYLGG